MTAQRPTALIADDEPLLRKSLTRTRQRPARRCTWISITPPSSLGSMPWRTAFSTSVSSVIGGQRRLRAASSTWSENCNRSGMRMCISSR